MFTLRRTVYLLFVTCAAYAAHYFINTPFTTWIIPVTYTLSLVTSGPTLALRQIILLLMGLVLVVTSILATYVGTVHGFLIAYLLIFILLYMRYLHPRISNTKVFVLFLFLTIVFANRTGQLESDLERASIIMLGVVIAMVSQLLFWNVLVIDNIERAAKSTMKALRMLNRSIFNCLLSPDYADNIYEYERQLHLHKQIFFSAISIIRSELPRLHIAAKRQFITGRSAWIESIFENMMDYAQIRWRIEDHSSYSLCTSELRGLETAVDQQLRVLSGALTGNVADMQEQDVLLTALDRMKAIYDTVLSVSIQEPLAVLLFMASLSGFNDKLAEVMKHG